MSQQSSNAINMTPKAQISYFDKMAKKVYIIITDSNTDGSFTVPDLHSSRKQIFREYFIIKMYIPLFYKKIEKTSLN